MRIGSVAVVIALLAFEVSTAALPLVIDLAISAAPITIIGPSGAKVGWSVSGGDFNGDSVADLAFTWRRTVGSATPPRVTILWSAQSLDAAVDLSTTGQKWSLIDGVNGDGSNSTSLTHGDFNGDGIDDLALGVVNNSAFTNYDGKVFIVFGENGFPQDVLLSAPEVATSLLIGSPGSSGWFGYSMTVGDVNNDELDDLIVSAPNFWPGGQVYIVYGRPSFPDTIAMDALGTNGVQVIDAYLSQATGKGLDCGDVNNDGFDDVLIGSPGAAEGFFRGTASLLLGGASLPSTIPLSNATPGVIRFSGADPDGQMGERVGLADVNGDGSRDVILSAYTADPLGCDDCGEIFVVYWQNALPSPIDLSTTCIPMTRLLGQGYSTLHGVNMVVGEVDGDGYADIVLRKEPDNSLVPPERRAVLIAHGAHALSDTILLRDDPDVTRIIAEQGGDDHGRGIAVVDLNGNGVDDVCIGAPLSTAGGNGGKVRVFFDCYSATEVGTRSIPSFVLYPNYPNPFAGSTAIRFDTATSVAASIAIFDVNGRLVRHLKGNSSRETSVIWDARDDSGQVVPNGVYFCRVSAGGQSATQKIVVVR